MNRECPRPGDLILVVRSEWSALKDGEWLRVCEQPYWTEDGKELNVAPRQQVRVFRGPDHGPPDGITPEHLRTSGGPFLTVGIEELVGLKRRCTATDIFWCWRDRPRAGDEMDRPVNVTIWCCQRLANTGVDHRRPVPEVTWTIGSPTPLPNTEDTTARPDSPPVNPLAAIDALVPPIICHQASSLQTSLDVSAGSSRRSTQNAETPIPPSLLSGPKLVSLMREHKLTIAELAFRLGSTQKRVRQIRETGLQNPNVIRDWIEAVTGQDPGRLPERYRINGIADEAECGFCGCPLMYGDDAWDYVGEVFCSVSCCQKSRSW